MVKNRITKVDIVTLINVKPGENISARIKLLCHPCNLLKVRMWTELVGKKLLAVELLVELEPAIDTFVMHQSLIQTVSACDTGCICLRSMVSTS